MTARVEGMGHPCIYAIVIYSVESVHIVNSVEIVWRTWIAGIEKHE